jgi:hypothetical protein
MFFLGRVGFGRELMVSAKKNSKEIKRMGNSVD